MPVGSTMYLRGLSFIPLPLSSHPPITSYNESPLVTIQILSPNSNLGNLIWILPLLRHPVTSDLRLPQACRPGLPVLRQMLIGKPASATPCSLRPWNLPLMTSVTLPLSGSLPVLDQVLRTSNRPLAAPGCWHCPLLVNQSPTSRSQFFTMNSVQCTKPHTKHCNEHWTVCIAVLGVRLPLWGCCHNSWNAILQLVPTFLNCTAHSCFYNMIYLHFSFAQSRHIALQLLAIYC